MSEPAFPIFGEYGMRVENATGMTLRDYFAAKAMSDMAGIYMWSSEGHETENAAMVADRAYMVADAMLKAREQ